MAGAGHVQLPRDAKFRAAHGVFPNALSEIPAQSGEIAGHCGECHWNMGAPVLTFDDPESHLSKQTLVVLDPPEMRGAYIGSKPLPFIVRKSVGERQIRKNNSAPRLHHAAGF